MRRPSFPNLVRAGFVFPKTHGRAESQGSTSHEGASRGRRLGLWAGSQAGPNAVFANEVGQIRARSADAIINNPWAADAVAKWSSNVVGRGMTPRWRLAPEKKELKKAIQSLWNDFAEECDADGMMDIYGMQALAVTTVVGRGSCLIRRRPRRRSDGLCVPLQLQIMEPDMLDDRKNSRNRNGVSIHNGIEVSPLGLKQAFHLRKNHPGDELGGGLNSVPVPASQIVHMYRVDRPGQLDGVPWLAPVLTRLYLLDLYEDAELDRKKTAALFAAFIKKDDHSEQMGSTSIDPATGELLYDANDNPVMDLEPGMIERLRPGESIEFAEPADVGGTYEVWIKQQLRAIAMGIGLTYEQLTGDLKGTNYTSIRAGALEFRRKARQLQGTMLRFQMCRKIAEWFMDAAVLSGCLDIPDYFSNKREYLRIDWQPDGWDWVDPAKDVTATKNSIRSGLDTLERACSERGLDVEQVLQSTSETNALLDELGIVLDTDPRRTQSSGSVNLTDGLEIGDEETETAEESEDDAEADDENPETETDDEQENSEDEQQDAA